MLDSDKLNMTEYENHLEHIGKHLAMMSEISECDNFADIDNPLARLKPSKKNLVICADNIGRYRSVAHAELICDPIERLLFPVATKGDYNAKILHLCGIDYWQKTCHGKCENC